MKVTELELPGARLIEPSVHEDTRGFFVETWSRSRYADAGIDVAFVQDNHSRSVGGTLRGLHYQHAPGQAKLVRVARGRIFDVAVDLRPDSPTFGRWKGVELDDQRHHQLFLPVGFAHGFCVLSEVADVVYRVSSPYAPDAERTIAWDDPELGIEWPVEAPLLSPRDRSGTAFADLRGRGQS
jgi:dTDP-4-dehydrorhamnose 3,5-epimerase